MNNRRCLYCNYCDRKFYPEDSTAEKKELFCSQSCEIEDQKYGKR